MKNLFKRHYNAIVNRGLITPETELIDFQIKITEEHGELKSIMAIDRNKQFKNNEIYKLTDSSIQESIDLIMVNINMLYHYGVDIEKELLRNVELQEKRANELNRIS